MYLNKVVLVGVVGSVDPARFMPNGKKVINLSIATKESWRDKESGDWKSDTSWHRLVAYGPLAEFVERNCRAKQHVIVEGRLKYRKDTYKSREGTEVKTDNAQIEINEIRTFPMDKAGDEKGAGDGSESGGGDGSESGGNGKRSDEAGPAQGSAPAPASDGGKKKPAFDDMDDDIPF